MPLNPATLSLILLVFRVVMALAAVGAVWYGVKSWNDLQKAPLEAELAASRGNQAASKAAADHQNKGVQARKAESDRKAVAGKAAVNRAGGIQLKRAESIMAAPPPKGLKGCEAAEARINEELGLR
jgi:hypothetical protein